MKKTKYCDIDKFFAKIGCWLNLKCYYMTRLKLGCYISSCILKLLSNMVLNVGSRPCLDVKQKMAANTNNT